MRSNPLQCLYKLKLIPSLQPLIPKPQPNESKTLTDKDGFQLVKNKRPTKTVIGVRKNSDVKRNIVQKRYISLFVSRLSPESTCDDVTSFVKQSLKTSDVQCEKVAQRYSGHSSIKVDIRIDHTKDVFDPENWPDELLIRWYFHKKQTNKKLSAAASL